MLVRKDWKRQVELRALIAEIEDEFPRRFCKAPARRWRGLLARSLPSFLCGVATGVAIAVFAAILYYR